MIKFSVLNSGSNGNSTLITVNGINILLDAGLSYKKLCSKLAEKNLKPKNINYIFVTHCHNDHQKAIPIFKKRNIYTKIYTYDDFDGGEGKSVAIGNSVQVTPFKLIHDPDIKCYGFVVEDLIEGKKLAYITDTVTIPCDALHLLLDCNAILIEANHDLDMLVQGPYSDELKCRVAETHLSNQKMADFLGLVEWDGLEYVILTHLSVKNNDPGLAMYEAKTALNGATGEETGRETIVNVAFEGKSTTTIFV